MIFTVKNKFSKLSTILYTFLVIAGCGVFKPSNDPSENRPIKTKYDSITVESWQNKSSTSKIKGWNYVAEKLIQAKIPKENVVEIFSSPDMPAWTPITFKVRPKESSVMYSKFNTKTNRLNALNFYSENRSFFKSAEKDFKVPAQYILAILQIETQCGKNTGDDSIFYWLARLVSTGFPPNLNYNFDQSEETIKPTLKEFQERAEWLEEEFMPHLLALFEMSSKIGISPMEVKGSKGGALGYPQFLPGNIAKFGVDGDKNGSVNLFTAGDSIHSVAKFLVSHGWKNTTKKTTIISSILEYNRSTAYAETVFEMARDLKQEMK